MTSADDIPRATIRRRTTDTEVRMPLDAIALPPRRIASAPLIINRKGASHVDADRKANGFDSLSARFDGRARAGDGALNNEGLAGRGGFARGEPGRDEAPAAALVRGRHRQALPARAGADSADPFRPIPARPCRTNRTAYDQSTSRVSR